MNCSIQSAPNTNLCCDVAVYYVIITNAYSVLLCKAIPAHAATALQLLHRLHASVTDVAGSLFAQLAEAAKQHHVLMVAEQFTLTLSIFTLFIGIVGCLL